MIFPVEPLFVRSEYHIEESFSAFGVPIDPFESMT